MRCPTPHRWTSTTLKLNKWPQNTTRLLRKLFFLRQKVVYQGMVRSKFIEPQWRASSPYAVTVWFGNTSAEGSGQLDKAACNASRIIGCDLPPRVEIYKVGLQMKGLKVLNDPSHSANNLIHLFLLTKDWNALRPRTSRFQNSTYPGAVRLLNSQV